MSALLGDNFFSLIGVVPNEADNIAVDDVPSGTGQESTPRSMSPDGEQLVSSPVPCSSQKRY